MSKAGVLQSLSYAGVLRLESVEGPWLLKMSYRVGVFELWGCMQGV